MSRKITFLTLFLWLMTLTFPVIAQQKADTTYTFRFVTQKDMFYVPWNGNDTELARLLECIENNKATILDGKLPLLVDGYCNSQSSEVKNLATAKIRANRVKSELITRAKIKEENFITRNHVTEGDFVTVRLTVPVKGTAVTDAEAEARRKAEAERLETEKRAEQERLAEEQRKAEEARLAAEKAEAEKAALQNTLAGTPSETKITNDYHLSLRANLLRWATMTPNLGLEWRICPSWGIAVNGSWTSWSWSDKDRRYALWEVAPEVRYYMAGEERSVDARQISWRHNGGRCQQGYRLFRRQHLLSLVLLAPPQLRLPLSRLFPGKPEIRAYSTASEKPRMPGASLHQRTPLGPRNGELCCPQWQRCLLPTP